MNEIDQRLAAEFENDAEWKAYQARVARIFTKRNSGRALNKEEAAILADYKAAHALEHPPKHVKTGSNVPPILYGYDEAADAFGVTRDQLYGLRSRKCAAFTGNIILSATLALALKEDPNPKAVPLNSVHTGRKGKLTPALHESIVAALRHCPILSTVAAAHGISASILTIWRQRGEKGEKTYLEFFNETEAAINQTHFELLRDVASDPDWRAKLAVLERVAPDKFAKATKVEHTGKDGGPITTKGEGPPPPIIINLQGDVTNPYVAPQPPEG